MSDIQELQIVIDSTITASNFAEWKEPLLATIKAANITLQTDQDFAEAEINIAALKASEAALKEAKEQALKKAADVFQLFKDIDDVTGSASEARLALSKQIKARKDEIKQTAVKDATALLSEHIDTLNPVMIDYEGPALLKQAVAHLEDAVKGKRSVDTMQKAIDTVVGVFTERFNQRNTLIEINLEVINAHAANNPALFSDANQLACRLSLDQLKTEIKVRLEKYKEQEAAKQKAAEAQENELQLRRELEEKANAEKAASGPVQVPVQTDPVQKTAQSEDLPAPMKGLKDTIAEESQPAEPYQITIMVTLPHDKAVALAKAIKQEHGELFDQIKLFKTSQAA